MSLKKNISGGALDVPLAGWVEADETVELPDFQADGVSPIVWPPDKWGDAAVPKAAKADSASGKAAG